ncbi:4-carboxymuconolactone decarboxylase [Thiorhodococcus mannitoliphagus]|uniref:4-carboxymuconolactone decarboxylase n=1 Tax=Thiorhodococcus mannitoliphagus TaxID=329406 RepID=A0A6P1E2E5_9GAMM|nr:carboxymuconolactone decarboxylase family protein [Thiorhodococcus mannitoliphagus]NEX23383.1 4-carboxymuconolactone decarboxylase [Thiorhodococcus mannitoliphagus]
MSRPPAADQGETQARFAALLDDFPWERPSARWSSFDPELAAELSRHIFAGLYARDRISLQTRQLIAVSALAALGHEEELRVHLWVALKSGVDPETLAEACFQVGTYAGLPATNRALAVLQAVIQGYDARARATAPTSPG